MQNLEKFKKMNVDEMRQIEGGMEIFGYKIFSVDSVQIPSNEGGTTFTRSWRWKETGKVGDWGVIWDNEKND